MSSVRPALGVALAVAAIAGLPGCATRPGDAVVNLTILHMNDVYEMSPIAINDQGGLARVAGLRKQLLRENPNTLTVLAGDVLSPSVMGAVEVDGERLAGKQMVDAMKHVGLDVAALGNHEFDLTRGQFEQRMKETDGRFHWLSANVTYADGKPLPAVVPHVVLELRDRSGNEVKVGMFGLTIETIKPNDYVAYRSPIDVAREQVAALRGQVDILIALTHLDMDQDRVIAEKVPGIDLILGGHEHENAQVHRGPALTPILKADANARTVFVHRLQFDRSARRLKLVSELKVVDRTVPSDPAVEAVVRSWKERVFTALRTQGFEPEERIARLASELDGQEASVRNGPTALTALIADSMLKAVPQAEVAAYNSGSIRLDDVLPAGDVTQFDVFRVLPYGGQLALVEMKGDVLAALLDGGAASKGRGTYLQTAGVTRDSSGWRIAGKPLDRTRAYRVVLNDFLLVGADFGLVALKDDPARLTVLRKDVVDIRTAVIEQLRVAHPR